MDTSRLKSLPLFESVSDEDLEKIAPFVSEVSVSEGKHLVDEGDYAYEFMAIEEGTAEVRRGEEKLAELGPGDFFGEMGLLGARQAQRHGGRHLAGAPDHAGPVGHAPPGEGCAQRGGEDPRRRRSTREQLAPDAGAHSRLRGDRLHRQAHRARRWCERGQRPVLAARSAAKLAELAGELGGDLDVKVADVSRPETVTALVEEGDVIVATVGPFVKWGGRRGRGRDREGRPLHRLDRRAALHP